jgi:O-antigen/teichoic acid export membrane protein
MLGATQSAVAVGSYALAQKSMELLSVIPNSGTRILLPRVVGLHGVGQRWELVIKATVLLTILTACVGVIPFYFADPLIRLIYGEAFVGAVEPLRYLILAAVLYCAVETLTQFYIAAGIPWFVLYAWIMVGVLKVILNFDLIKRLGTTGAALSSVICFFTLIIVLLLNYQVSYRRQQTLQT